VLKEKILLHSAAPLGGTACCTHNSVGHKEIRLFFHPLFVLFEDPALWDS